MSRLAPVLVVALVALRAAPARAEPLDVDLSRLGPPAPGVWELVAANRGATLQPGEAQVLADDAKKRFAVLSSELALALSGPILDPASTTGHAGFDFAFEGGYQAVHGGAAGLVDFSDGTASWFGADVWPTRSAPPRSVTTTGVHVRKALPWSFEFGGRLTYLNKSNYFAAQGEAKWALNEGYDNVPDLAVRIAYTRLFGQAQWNLGSTDLDFIVSKRWGVSGVTSFTPYAAFRFTFVNASSDTIDFQSATPGDASARFPALSVGLFRTTVGVRMTASTVSMALEGTYFGGKSYSGKDVPAADEYPDFKVKSAVAAAAKLGWEF